MDELPFPRPECLPAEVLAWAESRREVLELVAGRLLESGGWPEVTQLTRDLARNGQVIPLSTIGADAKPDRVRRGPATQNRAAHRHRRARRRARAEGPARERCAHPRQRGLDACGQLLKERRLARLAFHEKLAQRPRLPSPSDDREHDGRIRHSVCRQAAAAAPSARARQPATRAPGRARKHP